MTTTTQDEGLIYVIVPHQLPAEACACPNEDTLIRILEISVGDDFTYLIIPKEDWEAESEELEPDNPYKKQGDALFAAGAESIVYISNGAGWEVHDARTAPSRINSLFDAADDYHIHYILTKERALEILQSGVPWHGHQSFRTVSAIRDAAVELGWVTLEQTNDD